MQTLAALYAAGRHALIRVTAMVAADVQSGLAFWTSILAGGTLMPAFRAGDSGLNVGGWHVDK
jgi:hypothetical protein